MRPLIKTKGARRNAQHEYLLASSKAAPLLKCRLCHQAGEEHMMGGRTRHGPRGASRRGAYYSCWHWEGDRRVRHTVPAVKLEDAVWDALCAMLRDSGRVLARFERIAQAASTEAQELTAQLAALDEAQNENRLAQQRLVEMGVRGRIAADLLAQQEEKLAAEAHEIAQRKSLLETQLDVARQGQVPIRQVQDACALLADGALEAGFAEKRWLISLLVDVIYADKHGWRLEGRLPGMNAEGTFTDPSFEEQGS